VDLDDEKNIKKLCSENRTRQLFHILKEDEAHDVMKNIFPQTIYLIKRRFSKQVFHGVIL